MKLDAICHVYYYTNTSLRIDIIQTNYLTHHAISCFSNIKRTIQFYQQS